MPVTRVVESPSLNVSTVGSVHGTPMFCLIRATTSRAVGGCWARAVVGAATNTNTTSSADRRIVGLGSKFVNNLRAIGASVPSVLCPWSSDYSPPRGGRVRSIFVGAVVLALVACGAREVQRADPRLARLLADREAVWRAWFENDQQRLRELLPSNARAIGNETPRQKRPAVIPAGQGVARRPPKSPPLTLPPAGAHGIRDSA